MLCYALLCHVDHHIRFRAPLRSRLIVVYPDEYQHGCLDLRSRLPVVLLPKEWTVTNVTVP